MKAILIDSVAKQIYEVEANGLEDYYRLLDCDMIEVATYIGTDAVFIDESGLLKKITSAFAIIGAHQPFAGKGIVVGSDASTGDTVDVKHSVEFIKNLVIFPVQKTEEPKRLES